MEKQINTDKHIMVPLNFPVYHFKIIEKSGQNYIWDNIRKKHIRLTPEEWVRQNTIQYLINEKKYSPALIAVEKTIVVNKNTKRCDIVLYNNCGKPKMIVECKAPDVKITQKTFDQIAVYNILLEVDYLMITNGLMHFCSKMNYKNNSFAFLQNIPDNV